MHRLALAALTLALAFAPAAAHANTITQTFSVSGNTGSQLQNHLYGAASTTFSQFNPALGTLNSFSLSLQGSAQAPKGLSDNFVTLVDVGPWAGDGKT